MKHAKAMVGAVFGLSLAVAALPLYADGDREHHASGYPMSKHIKGTNITGPNDLCGNMIYVFPEPFPNIRLAFMGELNPDSAATDAIPLSAANCNLDTVLATTTDPMFLAFNQGEDTNPSLKNRPLRDVPIYVNRNGLRTHIARNSESPNPYPMHFVGNTEEDITLGQWLSAEGGMSVHCDSDTSSRIKVTLSHMIPNSLYTVWGWFKAVPPGETDANFVVVPLGGVPNTVTTDDRGRSTTLERHLSYCPMNRTEDGSELLSVVVTWHPDGAVYGAAPSIDFVRGDYQNKDGVIIETTFPVGVVGQDQMMFPVRLMYYN